MPLNYMIIGMCGGYGVSIIVNHGFDQSFRILHRSFNHYQYYQCPSVHDRPRHHRHHRHRHSSRSRSYSYSRNMIHWQQ
jgi:hypothetical protein